ncbi:MAG: type II secretion system protein GspC [Gammaproteobacteria bacterium]|nr:type II secretion system protein GspC [Gammaproteobacteria bacterium]
MNHPLSQFLTQSEQLQPLLRRLPVVLNVVLIIGCAQLLSEAIWMLVDDTNNRITSVIAPVNTTIARKPDNANKSQQAFRTLSSAHVFGVAETKTAEIKSDDAPDTKLNLVLRGVLSAGTPEIASAIIARGENGPEEIYGIGDKIPGGVTLREIHPEHVILEIQGRIEALRMEKNKDTDAIITEPSLTTPSSPVQPLSVSASNALKDIRQDLTNNPASFSKYAMPVVVRENGQQIGYRLQPQENSDLLIQAGLEPSDVITSINGTKLDNMQNSMKVLNELRSANQVSITVKRNGAEIPLNIQLQ